MTHEGSSTGSKIELGEVKGTSNWIEAKLDRILISDERNDLFRSAKSTSIPASKSNHLSLFLSHEGLVVHRKKKRNHFENLWLKDNVCRDLVIQSWANSKGHNLITRVERCSKAVWEWGKYLSRNLVIELIIRKEG